ncbi:MAG TPA: hypothetical protein VM286_06590 [Candidatus Thermoplasmatota archaeon]|nr:hypothetical protein [Candidatus Thermoplasmatota archaeon]
MESRRLATLGLWVFAGGMLAWAIANATLDGWVNVLTDLVILAGAVVAAIGLPRALDGLGPNALRSGLFAVAAAQLLQNAYTIATSLSATNAAPALVVAAASATLAIGARKWQDDGWDLAAAPWVAAGFAGYAFEPLYYIGLGFVQGQAPFGVFFPGSVLVATGAGLAAWAFLRPDPAP